ncbi:hypothetical protein RDI58_010610 [Solanum bulbocastanum]|uniref:Uncharacterized protein n=1 Tax=Solanum bulbocastanum TaxID=147425 RepID=A0AAN8YFJ6_SOLBU
MWKTLILASSSRLLL